MKCYNILGKKCPLITLYGEYFLVIDSINEMNLIIYLKTIACYTGACPQNFKMSPMFVLWDYDDEFRGFVLRKCYWLSFMRTS